MGCHPAHSRTPSFFRGVGWNHQPVNQHVGLPHDTPDKPSNFGTAIQGWLVATSGCQGAWLFSIASPGGLTNVGMDRNQKLGNNNFYEALPYSELYHAYILYMIIYRYL